MANSIYPLFIAHILGVASCYKAIEGIYLYDVIEVHRRVTSYHSLHFGEHAATHEHSTIESKFVAMSLYVYNHIFLHFTWYFMFLLYEVV